jgi:uncharacterized protein (TIGR02001 family)
MKKSCLPLLSVLLLCAVPSLATAAEARLVGTLAYTSDYVHRGQTQSSGQPAIQAGAGLRLPSGAYFSAWGSTVNLDRLGPDFGDGSALEFDLLAGLTRPLDARWRWDVNLGRYWYFADHRNLDYNYTELAAALSYRERLRASIAWTPAVTDHTRRVEPELLRGERWVYELSGEWPLTRWLAATGGVGYNDSREVADVTYTYWSAGANLRYGRYALALAHTSTDGDARNRWADGRAADRFVATVLVTFR